MSIGVAALSEPGARRPGTDARGAQGVQSGEGNLQINVYAESQSMEWPHQVGSVPLRADCYQQRDRETTGLDEALGAETVVLTQVLSGLGGVGKTQLAADYARRVWEQQDVELLVWATASSRAAVQLTYAQAAAEIGHLPSQDVERAAVWFLGWLQTTSRSWLVVLDDVADPADLSGLWPTGPGGRTVVTTRRRDAVLTARGRRLIDIGLYTAAEAFAYLRRKLHGAGTEVMAEAPELAADLGHLPLALAQAATFILDRDETCAGYRRRLHDSRRRLSEILPSDALADDYRATVAATWSISVELADELAPVGVARPVLELLSTLDANGVPLEIVISSAARTVIAAQRPSSAPDRDAGIDEQDCRDSLTNLHRLNLISFDKAGGARAISTHALVQRATLERLPAQVVSNTVRAAADALVQVWPEIERDTELGRALRDCAASLRGRHGRLLWDPAGHAVLFRAGRSLGECGLFSAAVDYWTEMASEARAALGPDHLHTLTTRRNVAYWRGEAGDHAGAAAAFGQLLPDCLRVLGADHPDTLSIRGDLAYWRGVAGDPVGAVAAFEELLPDYLPVLGADHPDTLGTRRNLANWRGAAGDPAGAATAFEELLPDCLRVLGTDHPDTLSTRDRLAFWRGAAGDPAGALAAFEQLFTDRQRVLGADHPGTLTTRGDLAYWRGRGGDPAGAVAAYEQLLADRLRVLGNDHPHTLGTRHALAIWQGEVGDPVGAVAALERVLTEYLRVLGPDHLDTLWTRRTLADWWGRVGDPVRAAAALEQLLADCLTMLGPDHSEILSTRRSLAAWRGKAGDAVGAVAALEQVLTDCLKVLGPDHPDSVSTRRVLATARVQAGDAECNG